MAGAVAISNFDTLMALFIRYDNLNYRQVKQSLQEFLFKMAVPTKSRFPKSIFKYYLRFKACFSFCQFATFEERIRVAMKV